MRLISLAILCLSLSCGSDLPGARYADKLVDCTDGQLDWMETRRSQIPVESRPPLRFLAADLSDARKAESLAIATRWSLENEYLPCDYQMCAAFYETEISKRVFVTIQPELNLDGWVPTSASFYLSEGSKKPENADTSHSGCAYRAGLDAAS
jgi:hypothetical protein